MSVSIAPGIGMGTATAKETIAAIAVIFILQDGMGWCSGVVANQVNIVI